MTLERTCEQCKTPLLALDGLYFCNPECQEKYWGDSKKKRKSISEIQKGLLEIGKRIGKRSNKSN